MRLIRPRPAVVILSIVAAAIAAQAWASEPPSCHEKIKVTYEAAVKNDEAAHKVAVERCQTTFPQATQVQSLTACVQEAGKTHQAHRAQYLEEYTQAKKACDDKIAVCWAQAVAARTKESEEIVTAHFTAIAICQKEKPDPAQRKSCTDSATAKRDQAEAASKERFEAAEARCKKLP